jgi:hypothetical protein
MVVRDGGREEGGKEGKKGGRKGKTYREEVIKSIKRYP